MVKANHALSNSALESPGLTGRVDSPAPWTVFKKLQHMDRTMSYGLVNTTFKMF